MSVTFLFTRESEIRRVGHQTSVYHIETLEDEDGDEIASDSKDIEDHPASVTWKQRGSEEEKVEEWERSNALPSISS